MMGSRKRISIKEFIDECRKRKIFRGLSIYALVSWVIIQVAATTFPYLGIPRNAVTFIIILVLIGLPISLIFSWYYNVVPDDPDFEVKKDEDSKEREEREASALSDQALANVFRVSLITLSIIVITIASILLRSNFSEKKEEKRELQIQEDRIAILAFENNTGEERFDVLGKAAADWISHGIAENDVAKVISSDIISSYADAMKTSLQASPQRVLDNYLVPERVLKGNIFIRDGNLIFKCQINDGFNKETIYAFEDVTSPEEKAIDGIEELKQKVLGYLVTDENPNLNLESRPPDYKAYELILEVRQMNIADDATLARIEEILEIDSNYFEAQALKVGHFYNKGDFDTADSLIQSVLTRSETDPRQANLIRFYQALISGKSGLVYETFQKEYNYAPFSLLDNSTMMVIALQFVYKPKEAIEIYDQIDMTGLDINNCNYCFNRLYLKALSELELENYREVIELLEPRIDSDIGRSLLEVLIASYIRSGRPNKVTALFEELPDIMFNDDWKSLYYIASREYYLRGDELIMSRYTDLARDHYLESQNLNKLGELYMMESNFEAAKTQLEVLQERKELSFVEKANLSLCYTKTGDVKKANELLNEIISTESKYDLGRSEYYQAYIASFLDDKEKAVELLVESVRNGFTYGWNQFHNSFAFKDLKDHPQYPRILEYWH